VTRWLTIAIESSMLIADDGRVLSGEHRDYLRRWSAGDTDLLIAG